MAIERAVVKGTIAGVVQTRAMFTCNVTPVGGDTQQILWSAYLGPLYTEIMAIVSTNTETNSYELQSYSGGSWVTYDQVTMALAGQITGQQLVNAAAVVLVGKASGLRKMGRKFISALGELVVDANSLVPTYMAIAVLALVKYITPFTGIGGGTIIPGIVDGSGTFHAFVGGVVSSLLGSIRRRKPGSGI